MDIETFEEVEADIRRRYESDLAECVRNKAVRRLLGAAMREMGLFSSIHGDAQQTTHNAAAAVFDEIRRVCGADEATSIINDFFNQQYEDNQRRQNAKAAQNQ